MNQNLRILLLALGLTVMAGIAATGAEEGEPIDSGSCVDCHEQSAHGTDFATELSGSIHNGLACLDCHVHQNVVPHPEIPAEVQRS